MATPATSVGVNDISPCLYAIVQQAAIKAVGATITFATRSANNKLTDFTASKDEVLGTGVAQGPDAVPLQRDKIGNLYLSKAGWAEAAKVDGGIYGYGTEAVLFKWPRCAPFRCVEPLSIIPTKITVFSNNKDYPVTPGQTIVWNGASNIKVGADSLWPTKITVEGYAEGYQNYPGSADILNCDLADFVQTIAWKAAKEAITVRLTEHGFEEFNVVQQAIHNIANGVHVAYPGPILGDMKGRGAKLAPDHKAILEQARAREKDIPKTHLALGMRP